MYSSCLGSGGFVNWPHISKLRRNNPTIIFFTFNRFFRYKDTHKIVNFNSAMNALPTIKQLQYLAALAETGSFVRAAARCNVTQSTLSAGIATLEDLLGQPVVERGAARAARLTPLGTETLRHGRAIIAEAEAIIARARSLQQPLSGPLRLGVIPTIAPYLLPRLLPLLQKTFPALELQLHEDMTERLITALRDGRLDLLLIAFPCKAPGIAQETLFAEPFVLACPRGQWPHKAPASLEQLKGHDILLLEDGHCLRDHALAACRLRPAAENRAFSATSLPTLIQMVGHGYGMTILPRMAANGLRRQDNIDIIPFRKPIPRREIGLAWRAGHPRTAEFTALTDAARTLARDMI